MDNCFVCDSYFYAIKNDGLPIENSIRDTETGESTILDSSKLANFCECMDLSPVPEHAIDKDVIPLCHRCTIASSKILLIQEQIMHLQNQVSQLQYSIAEKALITYYNNRDDSEEQIEDGLHFTSTLRKLLRDRWEEPGDKESEDFPTSNKKNVYSFNEGEKSSVIDDDEQEDSPATKRPASFTWSQNIKKKVKNEGLEPNILYVNMDQQYNLENGEEATAITIPTDDVTLGNEEYIEKTNIYDGGCGSDSIENREGMQMGMEHHVDDNYDDDDIIIEEVIHSNNIAAPNFAVPLVNPTSIVPPFGRQILSSPFSSGSSTMSSGNTLVHHPLKTYSKAGGNSNPTYSTTFKDTKTVRRCPFENCGKEFSSFDRYTEHINVHNGNAPTCAVCQKVFPRKYNLRIHMRTHTGEKPHKCPICFQQYADKSNLNAHIRKHYEKPFHCSVCRRMFDDINSAQSHVVTFHPGRKERNLIRLTRQIK